MKKLFCSVMIALMVICFMPTLAFATTPGTSTPSSSGEGNQDPTVPGGYIPYVPATPAAVTTVNDMVEAIPEAEKITLDDEDAIKAAREAFDKLSDEEKEKVEGYEKLIEAEKKIEVIKTVIAVKKVDWKSFKVVSKMTKLNGKKAVKISWKVNSGVKFDGFEIYRSTQRYKGFGTKPFFKTTKMTYKNNKNLKAGNTYYYKIKAYKIVDGKKVYANWSSKAWRTIK